MENNELENLRNEINEIDSQIFEQIKRRLECSKNIGKYKSEEGLPIYDPNREQKVIAKVVKNFEPELKDKITSIISSIMRISRQTQYDLVFANRSEWQIEEIINNAQTVVPQNARICCQGTSGSYSHLTAAAVYPNSLLIPALTFEECMLKLEDRSCDIALLPLENTTGGTVNEVYDLLSKYDFFIAQTITVPIHHKLVVLPGSDAYKVKTVLSHPQALSQCSKYIKQKGFDQIAVENTAYAVSRLKEINDPSYCAIASGIAGSLNNLEVLEEDICDSVHNQTRFVVVARDPIITSEANRISITFKLPHQSGSLATVLNSLAERGLNLTKIQSRPVPDKPWEYSFWADFDARRESKEAILALYQLYNELPQLKFIGWYQEVLSQLDQNSKKTKL